MSGALRGQDPTMSSGVMAFQLRVQRHCSESPSILSSSSSDSAAALDSSCSNEPESSSWTSSAAELTREWDVSWRIG